MKTSVQYLATLLSACACLRLPAPACACLRLPAPAWAPPCRHTPRTTRPSRWSRSSTFRPEAADKTLEAFIAAARKAPGGLVTSPAEVAAHGAVGKLRTLGVAAEQRVASFPEVPTMREKGHDVVIGAWRGMIAPKGTPQAVVNTLRNIRRAAVNEPLFANTLFKQNLSIVYKHQPDFAKVIQSDNARFRELLGKLGMLNAAGNQLPPRHLRRARSVPRRRCAEFPENRTVRAARTASGGWTIAGHFQISLFSPFHFLEDHRIPMKSLNELLAEKAALEAAIAEEKKVAATQALRQVHALVAEFGFTAQQVFPWKPLKAHVPSKYLDPNSGATWSGRGKPPAWIAGKDREQFLVQQAPAEPRQDGPYLAEMAADAASARARR